MHVFELDVGRVMKWSRLVLFVDPVLHPTSHLFLREARLGHVSESDRESVHVLKITPFSDSVRLADRCLPWKRKSPTMLLSKPNVPTMTMTLGLLISGGEMNRPKASSAIETHRATRKTPLMSAPRISARCHPYELALDDGDVASLMVYRATTRESTSLRSYVSG